MPSLRGLLEEKIQNRHLLSHSFYQRWQKGELSREELQGYVKEYYAFEKEFPRFLSSLHSQCEDLKTRQLLLENLTHEEMGEENHPELWLRFAEGLGVTRDEVKGHFHSDETEQLLRAFRQYTQSGDLIQGLSALYAYERQQPDVARSKMEGLKSQYGWKDEGSLAFFKAHLHYDVYHADTEATILSEMCQTEDDLKKAAEVTEAITQALYEFLDGIERRYAPAGTPLCATHPNQDVWEAMAPTH